MLILSIDSGFEKTGYSIFEKLNNDSKYISSGLITTDKKDSIENRLFDIYNGITKLIKKFSPDLIVLEQLFFFKNQKTAIKVSQAQGVTMLAASQNNIKIEFLTPLQIKQIITGYGQSDKKSVQKMLSIILGPDIPLNQDDEADAIACGLAYCYLKRF